jgi:hypothetical protein
MVVFFPVAIAVNSSVLPRVLDTASLRLAA